MFKQNKLQIFSFRKVKGYGLASAVIASMFLAQGVVSADVVTTPDGTKTTLSNDKASVTVNANHFKDSNDKSAKELYDAKEYEADKVTTGKDTVTDESKTVVSYETEDGTKLKEDVTKTATEEKELNYKIEGSSGKEYTGTSTPNSNVNADLEKQDTIEKDGEKYKYVRTETTQGNETVLTDTHFNDVETKASVEGMHNEDGSIKYDKIKDGSRVWVLEEKEDGTYGNYTLIENAQGLSDEKIQEAAKTATTKFSKAEVEKLGGIKDTDSIVVYETNTYAARKQTSEQFGKDFYYNNTANESLFRKDTIDKIFEAGLEGLEKRDNSYFYKGVEVPTIENFKTIPSIIDNKLYGYDLDTNNKYYTTEPEGYTVPTTYYNVINDFFIKNPESEIFKNKAGDVFWGAKLGETENAEEIYARIAFVTDILNKSLKDKYNIDNDTQDFKNKTLESKSNNNKPIFEKKYSFKKTDLHDNVKPWEETFDSLLDKELWVRELSNSYSVENVRKVRNLIKAYDNLHGERTSDVFNDKNDSDVTINEYAEAIYNKITSTYIETFKDQFTEEGAKALKNKFGNSPILKIGDRVGYELDSSQEDMTVQAASVLYRNSPGIITENTESFTYHDVITPLRAYRLTADNNLVRHIYEQVKRGSVVATYSDEEGNKLADDVNVKTNEYEGEDYQTEAKTIRPTYEYDTVNGLTKTTITRYELIKTPDNANGKVVAETTITVPYVYRKVVTVDIKGSVIATYKDEDGTILASEEKVITNQNAGTYYAAASKQIQAATSSKETEHGRKVTVITYELIKTPDNETGEVVGGETLVVPYVYRKVVTVKSDGGVVATHKDTEGNDLAPKEVIKSHAPNGDAYTTSAKEIPEKVEIDQTVKGLTRVTTIRYELVENPSNKDGNVVGGETITVPYVYKPVKSVQINGSVIATYRTEDGEKLADDVAVKTDAPSGEAYTTERKMFDNVTKEEDVNGFTRLTTTRYELIETPTNADGEVEADQIIYVPYVYRKVVTVELDGGVIATHKDTDGNELSPTEVIKSHSPEGDDYTTTPKTFDPIVTTDTVNGLTRTTTTTYELVETPTNANGQVKGGETIKVPYVYKKIVKQEINGSVIVTHHDENGVQLALDEKIKDNVKSSEPYTTSPKQFDSSITTNHVNGLTQTTYAHYELSRIPSNDQGEVEGGKTTIVPYIYRRVERIVTNGSVVATYKDTEGNELAPQVDVKTNVEPGQAYDTEVKRFPIQTLSESKPTDDFVKVTVTEYRLVKTPENKSGEVKDGQVIVVPYVYEKVVSVHYEKKDTPKPKFEIPKDAPKVEKEEAKFTRFTLEDRRTAIKDMVDGFVKPDDVIGSYTYTGITDSDEGGAVITHIYRKLETPEMNKTPNDAPVHDKPEFNGDVIPNDSPVHDKPEYNGGAVPNDSPIHDKPEYNGGAVPNDAPVHDKPEYKGGVVPNDAPVHDKPEFNGGVVPNDSPVHNKPKLDIPTPEIPTPTPELQKPETPSVETPKPKPQEKYVTKELPNTGSESSALGLLGFAGVIGSLLLLKKQKED